MGRVARLVVDADLPKRLVTELSARGREAVALSELLLHREEDEPMLRSLVSRFGDSVTWVLVTGDDAMPDDHDSVLQELGVTLATVDPRRPQGIDEDAWRRDVVHRWAHAMGNQAAGSIRRYSVARHGLWRPRRVGRRR
jgi:hypothetical protein